jgi:Lhr-like helicase
LHRIGLSATQKPVEQVARFLTVGTHCGWQTEAVTIIDTGHARKLDLSIEIPFVAAHGRDGERSVDGDLRPAHLT